MTLIDLWDTLRVLGLVFGSLTIVLSLVIAWNYWRMYRSRKGTWRALLPLHVVLIGLSYIALLLWAMEDMMRRFHNTPSWRLWALLVVAGAGLSATWDMLGYQRHRMAAGRR